MAILENQNNGKRMSNPALPTSYTSTGICHQRTDDFTVDEKVQWKQAF